MTPDEMILAVFVIGCITVVTVSIINRNKPMSVDPRVQASLDEIAASIAAIKPDANPALAQATQDATDTAAAVQSAADAVKSAIGA